MTPTQAATIAAALKTAFPKYGWPQERFDLYASKLLDLPYKLTHAYVNGLIETREDEHPPAIGAIRNPVLRRLENLRAHQQMIEDRRALEDRRPDPRIRKLLSDTIRKLEMKSCCEEDADATVPDS